MWHIALFYCQIQIISQKFSDLSPLPLPIPSSTWKWNNWLALKILLFSKHLLSLCLIQTSELFYIFCMFINPSYIFQIFPFISFILILPSTLVFFSSFQFLLYLADQTELKLEPINFAHIKVIDWVNIFTGLLIFKFLI